MNKPMFALQVMISLMLLSIVSLPVMAGGLVITNRYGQPCIEDSGEATPQRSQPNMYEHNVKIKNICEVSVEVRVCYIGGRNCSGMNARPGEERAVLLSIKEGEKSFRYEIEYVPKK